MSVATYEGVVIGGQVRLEDGIRLPERAKVFVIVPEGSLQIPRARIHSPRLACPEQVADFVMEVSETHRERI